MNGNGSAVKGVCVTGVAIRFLVLVVGRELSRWRGGYGVVFAIQVQNWLTVRVSRYKAAKIFSKFPGIGSWQMGSCVVRIWPPGTGPGKWLRVTQKP